MSPALPPNASRRSAAPPTARPLYRQVMDLVDKSIASGTLTAGDRLPSLRKMSVSAGVSIPTVQQAYVELERQRRIESRPRSGFFVRAQSDLPLVRPRLRGKCKPTPYRSAPLVQRVFDGIDRHELVPLGIANPSMVLPATAALKRSMRRVLPAAAERAFDYSPTLGEPVLRRQLAYHLFDSCGIHVDPDSICITNGGQEALLLALRAVAEPGDVIGVESPTYHGILELVDSLGMLAVEIETCPEDGLSLSGLERALNEHDIRACLFATTMNNPLGVSMTADRRRTMLGLLEQAGTVLIEDDVYGELRFDGQRPLPTQFLDRAVGTRGRGKQRDPDASCITLGSFSKTVAPGYRIGWILSGSHHSRIARLKRSFSCVSGTTAQLTLADLLASGDYARHLRRLRPALQCNAERMIALVEQHFPAGTRVSKPQGGGVLWVELPNGSDSEALFEQALEQRISIAPGGIFAAARRFSNFIRLSYGHPWDDVTEAAVETLGRLASEVSA